MKKTFIAIALMCLCGCMGSNTGLKIVANSSSYVQIMDMQWEEQKIPLLSIITGPRVTVQVNTKFHDLKSLEAYGSVTNDTSAMSLYSSKEQKQSRINLGFKESSSTNSIPK